MDIIKDARLKKLEILFSWSQFYQNSSLTVNRWPAELLMCKYNQTSYRLERYYPFNTTISASRKLADKVQQEIVKMGAAHK